MSTLAPSPKRRPLRAAVLDFLASAGPRPDAAAGMGAEEREFIDALRRIVAETGADELRDRLRGRTEDPNGRVYARYAD
jgi:hypothetical protein